MRRTACPPGAPLRRARHTGDPAILAVVVARFSLLDDDTHRESRRSALKEHLLETLTSLTPEFLISQRCDSAQMATLRALGEHRGQQTLFSRQTPQTLADLTRVAVIESTEPSTRLEGIVVSQPRIKEVALREEGNRLVPEPVRRG